MGGRGRRAKATLAQKIKKKKKKKSQHKLTLGRGWRGSIFPKADYPPHHYHHLHRHQCSLSSPPHHPPLTLSPRQAVPLAAVSTMQISARGGQVGVHLRMRLCHWLGGWGWRGGGFTNSGTLHMQISAEQDGRHPYPMRGKLELSEGRAFCWSPFRSTAGP